MFATGKSLGAVLVVSLLFSFASQQAAWGQFSPRGRDGGSSRGGSSRGGSGGISDFIRRMDTNRNGMIDPGEAQGGAGMMLQRMARENPRIDLSRPIPIDRLTREIERMREQRSSGSSSSRGDSRSSRSSGGSSSSGRSTPDVEPLVPGFGVEEPLEPILGFGTLATYYAVEITDEDRRRAERSFQYYDENKDGKIELEKMSSSRAADLWQFDQNKDNILTLSEMEVREARRRLDKEQQAQSSSTSSSSRTRTTSSSPSSRSTSSSRSSGGDDSRVEGFIRSIFERYDQNRNGVLEGDELSQTGGKLSEADTNKDSRITKDELSKWMAERMSGRGSSGGDRGSRGSGGFRGGSGDGGSATASMRDRFRGGGGDRRSQASSGGSSASQSNSEGDANQRKSYRFLTPSERLPEGLPTWFDENDGDRDGQILMAEFSSKWSDEVVAEFFQFDTNGDGVISPQECLAAKDNGVVRNRAQGVGASPFNLNSSAASTTTLSSPSSSTPSSSATSAAPASAGGVDARTLEYFRKYISKYDSNGNGELTPDEWVKMSKDPKQADADGNGSITAVEYAQWKIKK